MCKTFLSIFLSHLYLVPGKKFLQAFTDFRSVLNLIKTKFEKPLAARPRWTFKYPTHFTEQSFKLNFLFSKTVPFSPLLSLSFHVVPAPYRGKYFIFSQLRIGALVDVGLTCSHRYFQFLAPNLTNPDTSDLMNRIKCSFSGFIPNGSVSADSSQRIRLNWSIPTDPSQLIHPNGSVSTDSSQRIHLNWSIPTDPSQLIHPNESISSDPSQRIRLNWSIPTDSSQLIRPKWPNKSCSSVVFPIK